MVFFSPYFIDWIGSSCTLENSIADGQLMLESPRTQSQKLHQAACMRQSSSKRGKCKGFKVLSIFQKETQGFWWFFKNPGVLRGLRCHVESHSSTLSHPVTLGFHGSIHESRDKVFCTHSRCHLEQPQKSPINSQALITIFNGGRQGEEMTTHWSWQLRIIQNFWKQDWTPRNLQFERLYIFCNGLQVIGNWKSSLGSKVLTRDTCGR